MRLQQYLKECYTDSFRVNGIRATVGEIGEVIEAIGHLDFQEALYELSQVVLYLLILSSYALEKVGFDPVVPNWLPWEEDYIRINKWKEILRLSNAPNQTLDLEWFNQGNNWKRPSKLIYVLSQAGLQIDEQDAQRLIQLVKE
jgi:hypothetical protein